MSPITPASDIERRRVYDELPNLEEGRPGTAISNITGADVFTTEPEAIQVVICDDDDDNGETNHHESLPRLHMQDKEKHSPELNEKQLDTSVTETDAETFGNFIPVRPGDASRWVNCIDFSEQTVFGGGEAQSVFATARAYLL